jgi:Zn-dependent peptidase ImmA (M78 family)
LGTKISRQALHKYEKGEVIPDSEMMDYLCEALHVRPDYFTRETLIELGPVNFRKLDKLPSKEQNSIIERTKEYLMRYLELEEIMGIKKSFVNPMPEMNLQKIDDVEAFAQGIRDHWGLGIAPLGNVAELLEEQNIKVLFMDAKDEFDGLQTMVNNKEIPVIVINTGRLKSEDRKRFTALHELGHILLPDGIDEKMAEKYCHRFAGAMLLPKKAVENEIGLKRNKISIQELGFVKEQYGISIQALIYRLRDLDVIAESYKNYYFQYISQMGWKQEEPFEFTRKEISKRFDQLIFRALSEDIITMSKAATLMNMKLADFRTNMLVVG